MPAKRSQSLSLTSKTKSKSIEITHKSQKISKKSIFSTFCRLFVYFTIVFAVFVVYSIVITSITHRDRSIEENVYIKWLLESNQRDSHEQMVIDRSKGDLMMNKVENTQNTQNIVKISESSLKSG